MSKNKQRHDISKNKQRHDRLSDMPVDAQGLTVLPAADSLPIADLLAQALEEVTDSLINWSENCENEADRESDFEAIAVANATLARFAKLKESESRPTKKVMLNLSVSVEVSIPADEDPIDVFNNLVTYSFDSCDPSVEVLDTNIENVETTSDWEKYKPGML